MKLLVCGSRVRGQVKNYRLRVEDVLNSYLSAVDVLEIVEGESVDECADWYARDWANAHNVKLYPFPAIKSNLGRNIQMVELADEVLAFFDSYSYGTAHTIATAVRLNKPVKVINISRGKL